MNPDNENNTGIIVEGDLGGLRIEEISDDDEEHSTNHTHCSDKTLSQIPSGLVQPSTTPVFGSVAVTNSDNVQFGNNTYFNGPVTIKQIIQKSGEENGSYVKTENENEFSVGTSLNSNLKNTLEKSLKCKIQSWQVIAFFSVSAVVLGGICAVVLSYSRGNQGTTNLGPTSTDSETDNEHLLIAQEHLRIVSREDWLAQPVEKPLDSIRQPIPWVIITHTATEGCNSQSQCVLRVRLIQNFHIESKGWNDIGYNFLVGGDGSVYTGRGWDKMGAHTKGYNKYSLGVAVIGTFNTEQPPMRQMDALQKLLDLGVKLGKLKSDYILFSHNYFMSTLSPGETVFSIIKRWPHFVKNASDIDALLPNY